MITYEFDLDMVPGGRRTEVWLNQYDEDFELKINLIVRQGTFTVETGTTAAIRGTNRTATDSLRTARWKERLSRLREISR